MRDYLLFVDTETSGIPKSILHPIEDTAQWPYVLQLAWLIYRKDGTLVKKEDHFIFEEEIYIQKKSSYVHGITREQLKEKGENRKKILQLFIDDLTQYNPAIIGHFVDFDSKMLQVAMIRTGLKFKINDLPHFCTMKSTSDYAAFLDHQYPKLDELYWSLFGHRLERHHNAAIDAEATAQCFFELKRKGEITPALFTAPSLLHKVTQQVNSQAGCGLLVLLFIIISATIFLIS